MKAKTRKWATVSVLIELIASLILPLCFYFFKDFIGLDNIEQQLIVVLVYIGFFIVISTYILINHITYENSEQSKEYKKYLEIVKLWAEIEILDNDELREKGSKQVKETTEILRQLSEGSWTIEKPHEIDMSILRFVKEAQNTIKATHIGTSKWDDDFNRTIFNENINALSRDVSITRIFILTNKDIQDGSIKKIVEDHKSKGINVFCVGIEKLNHELIKDFIIFDGKKVLIEEEFNDKYVSADITINKNSLMEWEEKFEYIKNLSTSPENIFSQS